MELRREALKGARPTQVLGFFGRQHTPLAALAVDFQNVKRPVLCVDPPQLPYGLGPPQHKVRYVPPPTRYGTVPSGRKLTLEAMIAAAERAAHRCRSWRGECLSRGFARGSGPQSM